MRPRTTGILFLVALLLGAFIYLYELRGGEQDRAAAAWEKRLFPAVEATEVESIELTTSDGQRAVAERRDGGWWLTAPVSFAADDVALEGVASQLAQIELEGTIEAPGPASDYGLAGEDTEVRFRAGGEQHRLRIGRRTPVGANTYVRVGESGEIGFAATWRTNALRKSLTELRDRKVLGFDHGSVSVVRVAWPGGRLLARKQGDEWWLTEPVLERADRETLETLLSDLAFLQAEGFVDEQVDREALGLAAPSLRIVLEVQDDAGDASEIELVLGKVEGGSLVASGKAGALYRVSAQRLEDFPRELSAYRFKQLARFEVADARRFELVFTDEAGASERVEGRLERGDWATAPLAMEAGKASALLAALARLEAREIAADSLGESELVAVGLDPPRVVVRAWNERDELIGDVRLGAWDEDAGWLAQRADAGTVYGLDPGLSGQIPESADALRDRFLLAPEPGAEAEAQADEAAAGEAGGDVPSQPPEV